MGGVGQALQKTYDVLVKGEKPEAPALPPAPPPPSGGTNDPTTTAAMDAAAAEERKKAKGRASTYLTGASGLTTQATTASRTLLGS